MSFTKISTHSPSQEIGRLPKRGNQSLVTAFAWTGVVKWLAQLLSWLSTIIVARLLSPEDFGLVATAGIFLGMIAVLNEFGLGAGIVALPKITEWQVSQVNSLAWCCGAMAVLAVCLVAVPAERLFQIQNVAKVMVVSSFGFMLIAMRSVPLALYEKELEFKRLAVLDGVQASVSTGTALFLAWSGAGYWALVFGGLVGSAAVTISILVMRPIRFAMPSINSLRAIITFSSRVLIGRMSWYAASSSDLFFAARLLGQNVAGVYSLALSLASMPLDKVAAVFSRIMPAFYSAMQADRLQIRRYLLLQTEGMALVTFPLGVGMALVAQDLVLVLLGGQWHSAVAPLQILACWAAVRSVVNLWTPIVWVTGGSRMGMFNGLLGAVMLITAFWIGSGWGPVGLAMGWVIAQPFTWIAPYRHLRNVCQTSIADYGRALWPALSATIVMSIAVMGVQGWMISKESSLLRLTSEVVIGAFIYMLVIFLAHHHRIHFFRQLVRGSDDIKGGAEIRTVW